MQGPLHSYEPNGLGKGKTLSGSILFKKAQDYAINNKSFKCPTALFISSDIFPPRIRLWDEASVSLSDTYAADLQPGLTRRLSGQNAPDLLFA